MAAKTKTKAKKDEPQTWTVVSNGQEIEVEALSLDMDQGALIFMIEGGHLSRAFADGAWSSVELQQPEPDQD